MILAMPKKITIEDLARMVQEGFMHLEEKFMGEMDKRFAVVDERFDNIETRLDRIEHIILVDHRDRIERLEERAFGK
jgi:hypothetical protein